MYLITVYYRLLYEGVYRPTLNLFKWSLGGVKEHFCVNLEVNNVFPLQAVIELVPVNFSVHLGLS